MNKLNNVNSILKQYLFDTFNLRAFEINVLSESNVILTDTNNEQINISNNFNEIIINYNDYLEKFIYKKSIDGNYYWHNTSKQYTDYERDL